MRGAHLRPRRRRREHGEEHRRHRVVVRIRTLPPLSTESEQALGDGLISDKGLTGAPQVQPRRRRRRRRDEGARARLRSLPGRARAELPQGHRVLLHRASTATYESCEVRDVTGDGQAESSSRSASAPAASIRDVLMRDRQLRLGARSRQPIFQHEIGITTDDGSIVERCHLRARRRQVGHPSDARARAHGLRRRQLPRAHRDARGTPCSCRGARSPRSSTSSRAASSRRPREERQAGVAAPPPARALGSRRDAGDAQSAAAAERGRAPRAGLRPLQDGPRRQRASRASTSPSTSPATPAPSACSSTIATSSIFGKGFKGGTGYTYLTLPQFASPSDILEVTARDVTGDGKAEILVRGVLHANAPAQAGGGTSIARSSSCSGRDDQLRASSLRETARAIGQKRVAGTIALRERRDPARPGARSTGPRRPTRSTKTPAPWAASSRCSCRGEAPKPRATGGTAGLRALTGPATRHFAMR